MNNENIQAQILKTSKQIKQKAIIFLILVFGFIFWSDFVESFQDRSESEEYLTQKEEDLDNIKKDFDYFQTIKENINKIEDNKSDVLMCVNYGNCDGLNEELKSNFFDKEYKYRSYMLLEEFEKNKMKFNQRYLLRNIDEFIFEKGDERVAEINNINFSQISEEDFSDRILSVPVNISATVDNQEDLFSLLDNIENRIFQSYGVFYTISNIEFNVVEYEQTQDIVLNLKAYFYK
ncbi:hypothetical protein [Candidatus Absconditicoccus praedator]|uniref:hypothetical protein n=1 Tax=Candidatus Absconditicoccus praedator TaxID=2735562 RepID=UPI001E2C33FE|nr:hypothetical protein [Candidatus Absconditicoccus praedator]UFX83319.1 hypothetical protein HLG78_04290 [Candidatus Absconditicoccus praedator]